MDASLFCITCPSGNPERPYLLFSTKTGGKVLLAHPLTQSLREGTLPPETAKSLSDLGFLVQDREAEIREMVSSVERRNDVNTALSVTAVLNMDCNFSCVYCFEGAPKGNQYMTRETADHLIHFVKNRFTPQKKTLVMDFYGGEPLLSFDLIEYISAELQAFCAERNATYFSTIVTNGSLLTRAKAEKLAGLGLRSAKITLDGPPEIHDRYRPFASGRGSFSAVFKNVQACCDLIKIGIGGNYNRETYPHFVRLLEYMEAQGVTPDKLYMVKFDPIVDTGHNLAPPELRGGCLSVNEPWIWEAERFLREEILKRGYATPKAGPMLCAVEHRDQFVVGHTGEVYKCQAFIGQDAFSVGNIRTGVSSFSDSYNPDVWKNEQCTTCAYLPMCFGGCRYLTYLRNGKVDGIDCKKPYLDAQLEFLVRQDIVHQLSKP